MSDLPADFPAGRRARIPAAPICTATALLAATGYVSAVDPSRQTIFLPCPFHALTGWWCPGCGMTRAVHHVLQGDIVGALRYNALFPFVLALITVAWFDWYGRATGRRAVLPRVPAWATGTAIAVAVGFAMVRNLPGAGFLRGG